MTNNIIDIDRLIRIYARLLFPRFFRMTGLRAYLRQLLKRLFSRLALRETDKTALYFRRNIFATAAIRKSVLGAFKKHIFNNVFFFI